MNSLLIATVWAASLSGKDIMTRNENARQVNEVQSSATLTTGGGGTTERKKEFTWWRKLISDGVHYNTLTRFHEPAEVRGEGILFNENASGDNEVQIYLPNFKKIRRVETQQQSGSFMGSEFSYSDIQSIHVDDYKYSILREEPCPAPDAKGVKCHVVESKPVSEKVSDRTGYSKTVSWVRQDNFMTCKSEMYDESGVLWKRLEATEIEKIDAAKNKWLAKHVRVENVKNSKFTVLHFRDVKANGGIPDSTFTQQNLSKGR